MFIVLSVVAVFAIMFVVYNEAIGADSGTV